FLHRPRLPVRRARVVGERVDARPVDVLLRFFLLADGAVVRGAGNRDAIQLVVPDRLDGGVENRLRINVARGELLLRGYRTARQCQETGEDQWQWQREPSRHTALQSRTRSLKPRTLIVENLASSSALVIGTLRLGASE